MTRIAVLDVGNDSIKGQFRSFGSFDEVVDGVYKKIKIPNVISIEKERRDDIIGIEDLDNDDPLNQLHVKIESTAFGGDIIQTMVVGELATTKAHAEEMEAFFDKSDNDQTLALLFTSLAVDVADEVRQGNKNDFSIVKRGTDTREVVEARYILGTGLPVNEMKEHFEIEYKRRLIQSEHTVEFLQTPKYRGLKIRIIFDDIKVYSEGVGAFANLITDDKLNLINTELVRKNIIIQDIGGLTTDLAVLESGQLNGEDSEGIEQGTAAVLDEIKNTILKKEGVKIKSRKDIVDLLTRENDRYVIHNHGEPTNIYNDIVQPILTKSARQQFRNMTRKWHTTNAHLCYFVGGGSFLLKEELLNENQKTRKSFNIKFERTAEDSVWAMCNGYKKTLLMYLGSKQKA